MNLNDTITSAKEIDEQSKAAGFYQEALDYVARQGYGNASFQVGGEEGWILSRSFTRMNQGQNHNRHMTLTMFRIFRKGCSSRCRL